MGDSGDGRSIQPTESFHSFTATMDAYSLLSKALPSKVFPGKSGNFRLWDSKQSDLTPACRIEPSNAEDVSAIIKIAVQCRFPFAIRSGGHARDAGASSTDGGILIDLCRMNTVKVSSDRRSVKIGAGARWLDVYSTLDPDGLTVVGGRVAHVGVGGLLLGGGISFFSGRYGWGCDSVESFELVLPNGDIRIVDSTSSPHIFWALRGAGSSNFGVVTSFTVESITLPNPQGIWYGQHYFSRDKTRELLQQHNTTWTESHDKDNDIATIYCYAYSQERNVFVNVVQHMHTCHTSTSTWPEAFAPYRAIEAVAETTQTKIVPLAQLTFDYIQSQPDGSRSVWLNFVSRPSVELNTKLVAVFEEEVETMKKVEGVQPALVWQPLTTRILACMSRNGGNALGLSKADGPLIMSFTCIKWVRAEDDALMTTTAHRLMDRMENVAKQMGLWHRYKYINYSTRGQQVFEGYGVENLERLQKIQREVDPEGIFAEGGLTGSYFKLNGRPRKEITAEEH